MLSAECRVADPSEVAAISLSLHEAVMGIASGDGLMNSRSEVRGSYAEWDMPADDGFVTVRVKGGYDTPPAGLEPKDTCDVWFSDQDQWASLRMVPPLQTTPAQPRIIMPEDTSGGLTVEDLLQSTGSSTADEFFEWVNANTPNAKKAEVMRYTHFIDAASRFIIGASATETTTDGVVDASRSIEIDARDFFKFEATIGGDSDIMSLDYRDVTDYLGPLGIPAENLMISNKADSGKRKILAPLKSKQYRADAELEIDKDRQILTEGRLAELERVGQQIVAYAIGYAAGINHKLYDFDDVIQTSGFFAGWAYRSRY